MAITSYAELKAAITNWSGRSDLEARIPEFIALAQSKMYYGFGDGAVEPLRIDAMLASADLSPSGGSAAKPSGYLEARRIYVSGGSVTATVQYLTPEDFWGRQGVGEAGYPDFYTIEGDNFIFAPNGDSYTMKLLYYAQLTAMSGDDDADWFVQNAPTVYLYGALAELYAYIEEPSMGDYYQNQFINAVKGLQTSTDRQSHSGSVLKMRPGAVA